jgi:hypothetical protein
MDPKVLAMSYVTPAASGLFDVDVQFRYSLVPLSDGAGTDLVPAYANPFLFAFLAVSATCPVLFVWNITRDRTFHKRPHWRAVR